MIPQVTMRTDYRIGAYGNMASDKGKRPDENTLGNLGFGMNEGRFMNPGRRSR